MTKPNIERITAAVEPYGRLIKPEIFLEILQQKTYSQISMEEIFELFNKNKVEIIYYNRNSKSKNDFKTKFCENDLPQYKFVKLNNENNILRDNLYVSFFTYNLLVNGKGNSYEWRGAFLGNLDYLYQKIFKHIASSNTQVFKKIDEDVVKANVPKFDGYSDFNFYETLYNNLFLKERWATVVGGEIVNFIRLKFYLTNMCACIKSLYEKDVESLYYRESFIDGKEVILFDCRLLDKFGNRIFLVHKIEKYFSEKDNKMDLRFIEPKYIQNTQDLIWLGFNNVLLRDMKPFPFYRNRKELVFEGNIEDIDLDDTHHLNHIIKDRKDRLPPGLQDKSELEIYNRLRISVEYAVKISKMDYKLIAPAYSVAKAKIQFFIPIYEEIGKSNPFCALVMDKDGDRWVIYTILMMDVAYNNARLVSVPTTWLHPSDI